MNTDKPITVTIPIRGTSVLHYVHAKLQKAAPHTRISQADALIYSLQFVAEHDNASALPEKEEAAE